MAVQWIELERFGDDGAQAIEATPHVHRCQSQIDARVARDPQHVSAASSRSTLGSADCRWSSPKQRYESV